MGVSKLAWEPVNQIWMIRFQKIRQLHPRYYLRSSQNEWRFVFPVVALIIEIALLNLFKAVSNSISKRLLFTSVFILETKPSLLLHLLPEFGKSQKILLFYVIGSIITLLRSFIILTVHIERIMFPFWRFTAKCWMYSSVDCSCQQHLLICSV